MPLYFIHYDLTREKIRRKEQEIDPKIQVFKILNFTEKTWNHFFLFGHWGDQINKNISSPLK